MRHTCGTLVAEDMCSNGEWDRGAGESCRDGGGAVCRRMGRLCPLSANCRVAADCEGAARCHVRNASHDELGSCVSCRDGVQNGHESDVDCGGSGAGGTNGCRLCRDGASCAVASDCASKICHNASTCVSCFNGVRDGDESDVDCGGLFCHQCAGGRRCNHDDDCDSGVLSPSTSRH